MAELRGQRGLGDVAKSSFRLAARSAFAPAPLWSWPQQFALLPSKWGRGGFLWLFDDLNGNFGDTYVFSYIREVLAYANHLLQLAEEILMVKTGFRLPVEKACSLPPAVLENTWLTFCFGGREPKVLQWLGTASAKLRKDIASLSAGVCLNQGRQMVTFFTQPANCD